MRAQQMDENPNVTIRWTTKISLANRRWQLFKKLLKFIGLLYNIIGLSRA